MATQPKIRPLFDPLAGLGAMSNPQTNLQPVNNNQPLSLQVQPNTFTGMGTSADVPAGQPSQQQQVPDLSASNTTQQQQNQFVNMVRDAALQPTMPTPTFQQVQSNAQDLLADPTRGFNTQQQTKTGMDQFNRSAANQLEALSQQTANRFNTGGRLEDLVNANLEIAAQRPQVRQQIENQARQNELNMLLSALQAGSQVAGQEQDFRQQGFNNLINAAGIGESQAGRQDQRALQESAQDFERGRQESAQGFERELQESAQGFTGEQAALDRAQQFALQSNNIEAQQALTELQGKIAAGEQLRAQDFTRSLEELRFEQTQALASQDFERAIELENLRGDILAQQQQTQREFVRTERIATQGYMTQERIEEQDAQRALTILQAEQQRSLNNDNIDAAAIAQEKQNLFQLKMATQDMGFQERMRYLDNELQTAMANGNVQREKEILQFQHSQDLETLRNQQGFEESMAELQSRLRTAEANNDYENQRALQDLEFQFRADQAYEDRLIQNAQLALAQRGQDFAEFSAQYAQIKEQNPDAALSYLNQQLGPDFQVAKLDEKQAIMDSLAVEFEAKKAAYAQTHPDKVANGQLTEDGLADFNSWINETMYGEGGSMNSVMNAVTNVANALGSPESDEYRALDAKATDWSGRMEIDGRGFWNPDVAKIVNPPAINTPFRSNGRLLVATSGVAEEKRGQNYQYFTARDVLTGATVTVKANRKAGRITISGLPKETNQVPEAGGEFSTATLPGGSSGSGGAVI